MEFKKVKTVSTVKMRRARLLFYCLIQWENYY